MDLLQQFIKNWTDKKFAHTEQKVLLAVSGGVDSMVMADLFLKSGLPFGIAHCNFQLRGEDSNLDEVLVTGWAEKNNIEFHVIRFETKKSSEEWKKGTQETARILRYEWFDTLIKEHEYQKLATAHHANDNVETLIINLLKGTGIAGLHGVPETNGYIIRPMLFAQKEDVRNYAEEHNIIYREDASNETDNYLRNAVRHHIIPVVDKWFPNAVQHMNDSINRFAESEILYKRAIEQERKKLIEKRGQDFYIPVLKLQNRIPLKTICYELFSPFGFSSAQIPQVIRLLSSESGHYISSATHRVIRNRNFLIITTIPTIHTDFISIEAAPCVVETEKAVFHVSIDKVPKNMPSDNSVAFIDIDKVVFPLTLRKWRTGDYFYPLGMGMKKKKLSKYFIDLKLPVHEKEQVWVLESQKRIVWVTGMRLDERFKIKDTTEMALHIQMKPR